MTLRTQLQSFFTDLSRQNELYALWAKRKGIRPSTMTVLYALDQAAAICTQGQIANQWLLPKQTVHTVVQELEQAGYLVKESKPGQKEKALHLTPSGQQYAEELLAELYQAEEHTADAIGTESFQQLIKMNHRFTELFEQEVLHGGD